MEQTLFPSPQAASFVAIGDSFTEGLNDPAPGGGFLGWADRLAGMLAAGYPGLRYANLAVRGKLLRQIVHDQLPAAVALSPGLVSIAGGGNDILRPGADPDALAELFDAAVARLTQAGSRVLMFTGFDPVGLPGLRLLRGRIAAYNMHLRAIADARGCYLVDLWSMRFLRESAAWSPDRLHLTDRVPPTDRAARLRGPRRPCPRRLPRPAAPRPRRRGRRPWPAGPVRRARWPPAGRTSAGPASTSCPGSTAAARHLVGRRPPPQAPRPSPGNPASRRSPAPEATRSRLPRLPAPFEPLPSSESRHPLVPLSHQAPRM